MVFMRHDLRMKARRQIHINFKANSTARAPYHLVDIGYQLHFGRLVRHDNHDIKECGRTYDIQFDLTT
jgi:hypothetical protein